MEKLYFDYVELIDNNYYKLVFKPIICNKNLLNILSNFIRHSLFINTYGYRITEISLSNINNEYGHIFGLEEDIMNLILNLKGLSFKLKKKKFFSRIMIRKDSNIVTGRDIKSSKNLKILNPDHIICHTTKKIKLDILIKIEKGRGYIPFNSDKRYRNNSELKDGILIDSNFCPILRVSYVINNIPDSFYNDYNKLIFFIETDGSISAIDAIVFSINSLTYFFSNFKIFKSNKNIDNIFYNNYDHHVYFSIFDVGFTFKTIKILNSLGIFRLNDIIELGKKKLLRDKKLINKKIFKEIKFVLNNYNLII